MKNLSIILIAAMAFVGMACTKTEDLTAVAKAAINENLYENDNAEVSTAIIESETDPSIEEFVSTHFPEAEIQHCNQTHHHYKVMLNDRTKLHFSFEYEWLSVDCEHSTIYTNVPVSIVPEQITAYVTANFSNNTIEEIEKKHFGWEIELNNGFEIKFDSEFNLIIGGGDDDDDDDDNGGNVSHPEIETFVGTYFPEVSIFSVEHDGNKYEVKLSDRTEIDFKPNFEWKNIDCEHSHIYGSIPTELVPTAITDYVVANFPNAHIDKIEKDHNSWEIELSNGLEIKFDSNFNVIEIDDKK